MISPQKNNNQKQKKTKKNKKTKSLNIHFTMVIKIMSTLTPPHTLSLFQETRGKEKSHGFQASEFIIVLGFFFR